MLITGEIRYEIGRAAQRYLGISGLEFDLALEAWSYVGVKLFGTAYYNQITKATDIDDDNEPGEYVGGYMDRDATTGYLFSGDSGVDHVLHSIGSFGFDTGDQILQWQGIPDAGGLIAANAGDIAAIEAHSLGASRYVTLALYGIVSGGQVAALPVFEAAGGSVQVFAGSGDLISGFYYLDALLNPSAVDVKVPFLVGHQFIYFQSSMGQ
jgi:hypothetical protein